MAPAPRTIEIPAKILSAFVNPDGSWRPSLYKIFRGGRGSGKSESIARLLIGEARAKRGRILCTRMYQNSVSDSVHATLVGAAEDMGVHNEFHILDKSITHKRTGADFIFKGIQRDIGSIKSMKGVRRCWVEEAETVPKNSWQTLEPTFRMEGAEIWVSYNPEHENSATHQMALRGVGDGDGSDPDIISVDVNWRDNDWFPDILNRQRLRTLALDPDAYDWIWEGKTRKISDAVIFKDRVSIRTFDDPPPGTRILYGLDFGFADDPTAGVRMFILENTLYITHEAGATGVRIDDIPALIDGTHLVGQGLPGCRDWPMRADNSQPMTIDYLGRQGFNIGGADKWPGSVEDGVQHMRAFDEIVIHPRCVQTAQEFRLYSYKVDKNQLTPDGKPVVLPIIVDRWNHYIDAIRYGLDGFIQSRGEFGVWAKLVS